MNNRAQTVDGQVDVLEVRHVTRHFGAVHALVDANLTIKRGKVTALVGDNGAGKSTLVRIICGVDHATSGEVLLDGVPMVNANPLEAREMGIEAVYQDLALAPDLDVATNMFMGREIIQPGPFRRLDRSKMKVQASDALQKLQVKIPDIRKPVMMLSGGQRQAVAVARAATWATKVVIMDEPTSALGVSQTDSVLKLVRQVCESGLGVLLISHNMQDVFKVADEICVLRLGRTVAQLPIEETSMRDVVALMTGAES